MKLLEKVKVKNESETCSKVAWFETAVSLSQLPSGSFSNTLQQAKSLKFLSNISTGQKFLRANRQVCVKNLKTPGDQAQGDCPSLELSLH